MRLLLATALALSSVSAAAQTVSPVTSLIGPALRVSDPARAIRFYTEGLGMVVAMQMDAAKMKEIMLGFSKELPQPGLILLVDREAKTPRAVTHGSGFNRIILRAADIDALSARLKSAGYTPSTIRNVTKGYRMMTVSDPDGYQYEIVQAGAPR